MNPHVNDMSTWPTISCQRGHSTHSTLPVEVDLSVPHGLTDLPAIPSHLAVSFSMQVWDWERYKGDREDGYCPADDCVSDTISTLGIWEPPETILALWVLSTADSEQVFVDCGAQLGWFCHLATASRITSVAYDADPDCVQLLRDQSIPATQVRFGVDEFTSSPYSNIRLLKMDLEGSEEAAIWAFTPTIEAGNVDHILMEVSPVFNDSYPGLVLSLIDQGYELFAIPDKHRPPYPLATPDDLTSIAKHDVAAFIDSRHQQDVWLKHEMADW